MFLENKIILYIRLITITFLGVGASVHGVNTAFFCVINSNGFASVILFVRSLNISKQINNGGGLQCF